MKIIKLFSSLIFILFSKKSEIVFYSESSSYQKYFIDIILKLCDRKKKIIYLSSDLNDIVNHQNVKNFYIGNGLFLYFTFLMINAKNLILTVPDLGNNQIKKSKYVDNYIYIFHASNSVHKQFTSSAFDNFDTIFCNGSYQIQEIKFLEKYYKTKEKKLVKTGYHYFDYLKKNSSVDFKQSHILIAPSWNYLEKNFFTIICPDLIKKLILKNYKVVLRPHPEHYKRYKNCINQIIRDNNDNKNFFFDNQPSNIDSMNKAKLLITDCSGIAPEFLFTYKRPVIYFPEYPKIHNKDFDRLEMNAFEDLIRDTFGHSIYHSDIEKIDIEIEIAKNKFKNNLKNINDFVEKNFYNFQNSISAHLDYFQDNK